MILLKTLIHAVDGSVLNATQLESEFLNRKIRRPTDLKLADSESICFFFSRAYINDLKHAKPSVLLIAEEFGPLIEKEYPELWKHTVIVVSETPYWAMAKITKEFANTLSSHSHVNRSPQTVIHPSAVIDSTVVLGESIQIGPHVVIGPNCRIDDGACLYPGVVLASGCTVGADTVLFSNVQAYENTQIGSECRIHAGVVLGADGFGFALKKSAGKPEYHEKIYHFGRVIIGNRVEIGANTTIDRGTFDDTIIADGAKIDNLVQIGHNCHVGEHGVICGNVGMAGNSSIGRFSVLGGGTCVNNKVHVSDFAQVGGMTGVSKNVPPGGVLMGLPGRPLKDHFKLQAVLNKMLKERNK